MAVIDHKQAVIHNNNDGRAARVFVTVGMDHHPFNRLMRWVDEWLSERTAPPVLHCQVGTAVPPRRAAFVYGALGVEDVERHIRDADVVICHAGPGTLTAAWRFGNRPIVVPRLARYGECVDDHQVLFAQRLRANGKIVLAESRIELAECLEEAFVLGTTLSGTETDGHARDAVEAFSRIVDPLLTTS